MVARHFPDVDPIAEILAGHVRVDGFPVRNPDSRVARDAAIVLRRPEPLAGEVKLRAALAAFAPAVAGRVAIDVGASAGGFTRVLLEAGARRVYAVDAGFGQLLGSLRQDPRVVNLEATNLGALDRALVPERIELVTIDVSYVALAAAVPQLEVLELAADAELIALVKPMFELGLDAPPPDDRLPDALARAVAGIARTWRVTGAIASPVTGHRGAKELLVHARRV
ncbi:MAG TPA: SAM-dependent methyltransferase [Kofleriaceae bacterium]|nr:SAM-dependent methyltransferase [Kofleriaceae bacterium]